MATVNFYLKGAYSKERLKRIAEKKSLNEIVNTPRQIYLMLSSSGKRIQIYTKKRIEQKYWDFEKQEIDCQKYRQKGTKINNWLSSFRNDVLQLAMENELSGKHTTKNELEESLSSRILEKIKENQFDEQYASFLQQHKTGNGYSLRNNTLKKYKGLYNHLKAFASKSGIDLNVKYFDKQFLLSFKEYLIKIENHNDNTVAKYIKAAKPLIRYYMSKGITKIYPLSEVKAIEKEGTTFVLSIKEVLALQKLTLKEEWLKHARDIFCFMCWTGQRYSDYENLNTNDFSFNERGEKIWKLVTVKTNTSISVPIIDFAEEILNRYKNHATVLPRISNQKVNKYLKEIGRIGELNKKVKLLEFFDGKKREKTKPFYEVLTTHIARKSFITNSLILGIPERVIKDISGHKDEKSFRRYVHLADAYKSDLMSRAYSRENVLKFI